MEFVAFPPARGAGLTMSGMYKFLFGWGAAMFATFVALNLYLFLAERYHWQGSLAIVLGLSYGLLVVFVLGFLAIRWRRRRTITIRVVNDGVTVDRRPGVIFSPSDATLGVWATGDLVVGTALHLIAGTQS